MQEKKIKLNERAEEVLESTRVGGEIVVGKQTFPQTQKSQAQIRYPESGMKQLSSKQPTTFFCQDGADFRNHFQAHYTTGGGETL